MVRARGNSLGGRQDKCTLKWAGAPDGRAGQFWNYRVDCGFMHGYRRKGSCGDWRWLATATCGRRKHGPIALSRARVQIYGRLIGAGIARSVCDLGGIWCD